MYCNNCGKHNSEDSKFCQFCGAKLAHKKVLNDINKREASPSKTNLISQNVAPYPYVISPWKLFILGSVTFGIYIIYWFYRQFKSFYALTNVKHGWFNDVIAAIFCPVTSYSLFKMIRKEVQEVDLDSKLATGALAVAFFVCNLFYRLPNFYWLLGISSIIVLIPVQNSINYFWEKKYGEKIIKSRFGVWNYVVAIVGAVWVFLALYSGSDFKTGYKKSFVKSCEQTADSASSYCECLGDYMVNNYSETQLTEITTRYEATKQIPPELQKGADTCVSK